MAQLVTVADAKLHLHITDSDHDADVQAKLDEATDIIVNYLKLQADPTWDVSTVPPRVQSGIKLVLAHLYEHRGDDAQADESLWTALGLLLARDRDPALGMSIGAYRHRVTLENPGPPQPDGEGGYTEAWFPLTPATWDCSIQSASARDIERMVAGVVQATSTHLVRGRYHPQITTETRFTFRGRVFQVQSVSDVDERQVALILVCAEVRGGGSESASSRRSRGIAGGAPTVTPGFND